MSEATFYLLKFKQNNSAADDELTNNSHSHDLMLKDNLY